MTVAHQLEPGLSQGEFVDVLHRSALAGRRPVDRPEVIRAMLEKLVGVARAISDFSYCTYLSDLAVDVEFQRRGIGRELIRRTHEAAGLGTTLILLAAPKAEGYYPVTVRHSHP